MNSHGVKFIRQALAGESRSEGQVILSWLNTLEGAAAPDHDQNVAIHKFAHQLDQETGATDPAEFSAVISEDFFEQPQRMADEHPTLYQELTAFYRLAPLSWPAPAGLTSPS